MNTTEEQAKARERFEEQEALFVAQEKIISDMRAWIVRNRERIAKFDFSVCNRGIHFYSWRRVEGKQKEIARAFGKDGRRREKDAYTCGAIHWVKDFDGAQLTIHEAEIVNLNPVEEVKL